MESLREKRAKRNSLSSLLTQVVTVLCGVVLPKLLISTYGSEAYGAVSSITQFLAYITLLESGIGGVARAALYKPLAENDLEKISGITTEIQRFFRIIAWIFLVYVAIIACIFKEISHLTAFDWLTTFALVCVLSISTCTQYFVGITNTVLLLAAQKNYIINAFSVITTILNVVMTVILVHVGCHLVILKLVTGCLYILRPIALKLYVNRYFGIKKSRKKSKYVLDQKWAGLGQHIAYFLYSNTDVVVLTVFADLTLVAVYSVYNMIISHVQSIVVSVISGMESLFGELIAKEENETLHRIFNRYETLISLIGVVALSSTAILIIPFVNLYVAGVTDANYRAPKFAILMVISSLLYCLRTPYHAVTIAAGHFKQTRIAAYGEAAINVVVSIILVQRYGLLGVAIGTIVATTFRFLYYVGYLSKEIMGRKVEFFIKRTFVNVITFAVSVCIGYMIVYKTLIDSYLIWVVYAVVVVMLTSVVTVMVNLFAYHDELLEVLRVIKGNKHVKIRNVIRG